SSARSIPAQKAVPAPVMMTLRAAASPRARINAAVSAATRPRLNALRRAGRLSVSTAAGGGGPEWTDSSCPRPPGSRFLRPKPTVCNSWTLGSTCRRPKHFLDVVDGGQRHPQQRQSERFALVVAAQRAAGTPGQHVVQHEIARKQIGCLVADDT